MSHPGPRSVPLITVLVLAHAGAAAAGFGSSHCPCLGCYM
jgi:hypothetical protein